jgi:FdrA protein
VGAGVRHVELRRGTYRDSVRLMEVSRAVAAVPGVRAVLVAMATELNLGLAAGQGFATPPDAGPNDLVVAVDADDVDAALTALAAELDRR